MMHGEPELLERETESALIADAIDGIEEGGGLLLVKGVAGTGKSRLLSEIRTAATQAGLGVVTARGTELEQDFAFGVVRQLFEMLAFRADRTPQESLWTGAARQAREAIAATSTAGGPGDFAVLHGLYWFTINVCQDRPLVLTVDDLQWCDRPSLRYLAYLLPRIEEQPLLVAVALRTGERATDERLLQQVISTPALAELEPKGLSVRATASLLQQVMHGAVDEEFAAACHRATGGNPLLLRELALTFTAQGVSASARNAERVADLGGPAVAQLVASRLMALPEACTPLARAVAVLGDHSPLMRAARLAGQDPISALECAILLEEREIVHLDEVYGSPILSFVHPLVRNAVYESLDRTHRATSHHRAAILLRESSSPSEQVAYHLMKIPPTMDPLAVADLRAAAAAATARGAPESAYVYLRRSLDESLKGDERRAILLEAGKTALLFDVAAGAHLLQEAWDGAGPVKRAEIAPYLGTAYIYLEKPDIGFDIQKATISGLSAKDDDLRKRLQASLLSSATWYVPGRDDILDYFPELRRLPHGHSFGDRLLGCAIAGRTTALGDPSGVLRARETLTDDVFVDQADPNGPLACGWWCLAAADDDTSITSMNNAVKQAHVGGSLFALASIYIHRGYALLWHGDLAGAEQDGREAIRVGQLSGSAVARLWGSAVLAESLIEQGRLDEAEQVLAAVGVTVTAACPPGPVYLFLPALGQLQRVRGDDETALNIARRAEQACHLYDIHNPAVADWRTLAALALHHLDRNSEARAIADENFNLARRWGAPRTLGRALRVSGLISPAQDRLEPFEEAVNVLKESPAHLEHAKALVDLGAALRKAGRRTDARPPLQQALDLATRCGAVPVADRASAELAAAGARRRRTALTGPGALTPSERRVADLAANGQTNRQIAQTLFVTPKTVEVHLSNCYRKLCVTSRIQLSTALHQQ